MDIERKNAKLHFEELDPGEVFEISNMICMKIKDDSSENNVVDLKDGCCRHVQNDTLVTQMKANLIVR